MIIYIHVPFCRSRCSYCAFHSLPLGAVSPSQSPIVAAWLDTLLLELAFYADTMAGAEISSVFFGGGTPSLLPPRMVGAVMERIGRHFSLSEKAEVTLEANPESLRGRNFAPDYLSAGVNRLSIGLQSMDEATLRMLGRPHRAQDSLNAVYAAKAAGFANVGVDLMWGLPNQSVRQWLQTLKEVVKLSPEHISAYGLTLEPGTPLAAAVADGRLTLPPERDQNIMFMEGAALLEAKGYLHYEISNFARMGFQSLHNLSYWEGQDYLGLGPSATSTLNGMRWTNPADQIAWDENVRAGNIRTDAETLGDRERVLELIMLRLRTARGLRLKDYKKLTGREFLADYKVLVQALHENGLIRIREGYLRLTRSGMLVSNAIISNLFERVDAVLTDPGPKSRARMAERASHAQPVIWPQA